MKFIVLTLFKEMFESLNTSILKRGIDKKAISLELIDIRDFKNKHKKVDDMPYGGGSRNGYKTRCCI